MNNAVELVDDKNLHSEAYTENVNQIDKGVKYHVEDSLVAQYVNPDIVITPEENKRLKRKMYKHLLPWMCIAYITQSLDKGTLGSSSIMGWQKDVHAVGQDYAMTTTYLWIGIICGEPIINQLIRRLPVAKLLGISMFVWTALLFGLAFSLSMPPVFAMRFLLGFFESAFGPCLVTITVQWFLKEEQTQITTIWQAMLGVAAAISNLIAYGFYQIGHGNEEKSHGLHPWQWMTVTIACISFLSGVVVLLFLPDSPVQARWATAEEKTKYVERVRANDQGIKQKKWKSEHAWEAAKDPFVYSLFIMLVLQTIICGGLGSFANLLVNKAFGFSVSVSLLIAIPQAVFQVCLYFLIGWLGTKTGQTCLCILGYVLINVIGTIVLITVAPSPKTKGGLLWCFYLMQCMQSITPSLYVLLSRNVAGQTKKSIVYAIFFIGWAGGNAIAPQLFQSKWAPRYIPTLWIHIGIYAAFIADLMFMRQLLVYRNKKRDQAMDSATIDHSLAFEDLTDIQNPEFRYSY